MNLERFEFKTIDVEPFQVKEVLGTLLHSIVFNRALGSISPKEIDCEALEGISYCRVSDPDIFRLVDTNITRFLNNLINQQSQTQSGKHDYHTTSRTSSSATITTSYKVNRKASQSGTVCLSFYAKTFKRQWFSTKEEKVYWEQWVIPINIVNHSSLRSHERETRTQELKDVVRACLAYIVKMVNEKKDHIPPVISKAMVCFPFDLTSSAGGGEGDDTNWSLNNFARMLKQGPTFKI